MRAGLACDGGAAAAAALDDSELTSAAPTRVSSEVSSSAAPAVGAASVPSSPRVTPVALCTSVLKSLMKRRDAIDWFNAPVPPETEGYLAVVSEPMDYGTILSKLESGAKT